MGHLLLVTGGARSARAIMRLNAPVPGALGHFIATCQPADDEMRERVRRHQEERPSTWRTLEPGFNILLCHPGARTWLGWNSARLPYPLRVGTADVRQRRGGSEAKGR